MKHKGITLIELVVVFVLIALLAWFFLILHPPTMHRESARRAKCQNNLKQWGIVFKMYASENSGRYPTMLLVDGQPSLPMEDLYPRFMDDPMLLFCPADPFTNREDWHDLGDKLQSMITDAETGEKYSSKQFLTRFSSISYVYYSFVAMNDRQFFGMQAALENADDLGKDQDIKKYIEEGYRGHQVEASGGSGDYARTIYYVREGIERFLITDINGPFRPLRFESLIPVMWDRTSRKPGTDKLVFNHETSKPYGCNVLFMDGHVEYIEYKQKYPVTTLTIAFIADIPRPVFKPEEWKVTEGSK